MTLSTGQETSSVVIFDGLGFLATKLRATLKISKFRKILKTKKILIFTFMIIGGDSRFFNTILS
jgi:hypothetical protein